MCSCNAIDQDFHYLNVEDDNTGIHEDVQYSGDRTRNHL
jgi:hypothetical protein